MNITFSDDPPADPMDGDYLMFDAIADGKPIKCCITFDLLIPRSNNPNQAKLVFRRKKHQIHATARATIEAGEIEDGEILITSLIAVTPDVVFPDVSPTILFERDALSFPAVSDGEPVMCVVSFELLIGPGSNDADEAIRVFQTQKTDLHEKARALIQSGRVDADGELLITTLV
jgi:hypothetical protein